MPREQPACASLSRLLWLSMCVPSWTRSEKARGNVARGRARAARPVAHPPHLYISIARSHPRPILPLSLPYRSRLKSVLLAGQISTFCDEVDRVSGEGLCKLFLAGGLQKAERS